MLKENKEFIRKIIHLLTGVFLIALLFLIGKNLFSVFLFILAILILVLINSYSSNRLLSYLFDIIFYRDKKKGYSSFLYVIGILFASSLLTDVNQIAAIIFALAFGDYVSNLIGSSLGKHKIFNKSLEGTIAMFIVLLFSSLFIPNYLLFSLFASLVELLSPIDDNLALPLALALFFKFF